MATDWGFVYVLGNSSMPGIYKVGCTERPPHARAEELSRATGVARRFKVICYGECCHFKRIEGEIHTRLAGCRVSDNREFFSGELSEIIAAVQSHHRMVTFCMVDDDGLDPLIIQPARQQSAAVPVAPRQEYQCNRDVGRAALALAMQTLVGDK